MNQLAVSRLLCRLASDMATALASLPVPTETSANAWLRKKVCLTVSSSLHRRGPSLSNQSSKSPIRLAIRARFLSEAVTETDGHQDPECHPKNLLQCQLDRHWTPAGHPSLTYGNTVVHVSSGSQHGREAWLTIQPITPRPMRQLSFGAHSEVHMQKDSQAGPDERDRHRGP